MPPPDPEHRRPPSMFTELPRITFASDGCVMGAWGSISLVVWATQATLPLAQEFEKLADEMFAAHARASSVHLIINAAPLPTAEARAVFNEVTERYVDRVGCTATMVEGDGFWASAMRSFLTGIFVIQRRPFPVKTVAHLEDLPGWLAPTHNAQTGEAIEPEQIERALAWLLDQPTVRGRRI
jgi:hypothetical protein